MEDFLSSLLRNAIGAALVAARLAGGDKPRPYRTVRLPRFEGRSRRKGRLALALESD
jgi:hypothetical protein